MDFLKCLHHYTSFLFDTVIEQRSSPLNPVLEIRYYKGRYMLDAAKANYSFGKLHLVFEQAFQKINTVAIGLKNRTINNALILGYGGGSIAHILNGYNHQISITGIEHDKEVIDLAVKYFHLHDFKNVKLIHADAEEYVRGCDETYDLIAIDLYNDTLVPVQFCNVSFFSELKKLLKKNGIIVFNRMLYGDKKKEKIALDDFKKVFPGTYSIYVLDNMLLIFELKIIP